ncbi:hypothetical protein [Marmoricola sp. URHB0036]|uniref:DUF7660 family protein n=1 Tax=Marmoricola sp. URHB0036 TaxID=1298863 RepID=UPI000428DA24|nr:hypothetical protein [Marmoricola sp. URHB0036]
MSEYEALAGRGELLKALEELQGELQDGAAWENNTLERFLDGFSALLGSIENAYANTGQTLPVDPWLIVAEVFRGARDYE